jgi:hypothetical protein
MTDSQVLDLLGQPLESKSADSACVWCYQEAPVREGDRIIRRPRSGLLRFRKGIAEDREALLLISWIEPNWENFQSHTLVQWHAQQRRLEAAERQKQIAEQQQKWLDQRAEQTKLNVRPAVNPREPVNQTTSQSPITPIAPTGKIPSSKKDPSIYNLGNVGFIIIGGIIIGLGIAVAIFKGVNG